MCQVLVGTYINECLTNAARHGMVSYAVCDGEFYQGETLETIQSLHLWEYIPVHISCLYILAKNYYLPLDTLSLPYCQHISVISNILHRTEDHFPLFPTILSIVHQV